MSFFSKRDKAQTGSGLEGLSVGMFLWNLPTHECGAGMLGTDPSLDTLDTDQNPEEGGVWITEICFQIVKYK